MGRRLVLVTLLVVLAATIFRPSSARSEEPVPTVPQAAAALSAVDLTSRATETVVREGLVFEQQTLLPGTASWSVRLQPRAQPGRIVAHGAGAVVGSKLSGAFPAAGAHSVTVPLTARGARLVRRRALARLTIRTTFTDGLGRTILAASSVAIRR